MSKYHLAQLNIATMLSPLESPQMQGFVDNLDRINALADQSSGFVWRLQSEEGDATSLRPFGDDVLVNMSVWRDVEALRAFVFSSEHIEIMRQRRSWFERMSDAYMVLWWVEKSHIPPIEEAAERLAHLRKRGATEHAFTFRQAFGAPDQIDGPEMTAFDDVCPAT